MENQDRELLELAAKAAGLNVGTDEGAYDDLKWWNPLTDDCDALRLAVKLRINLWIEKTIVIAEICSDDEGPNIIAKELDSSDAATRRAIVRAAAEIGKGMK